MIIALVQFIAQQFTIPQICGIITIALRMQYRAFEPASHPANSAWLKVNSKLTPFTGSALVEEFGFVRY
jgi:hypothetical protein